MLSFLLKQNWSGIDYFLSKFLAIFGSILGLQITVGLQVNSGFQPPTRSEPFVAGTMLRRLEPTKERVEPTILSIIAIGIWHLTKFALLLQLRILCYMCRNQPSYNVVYKWICINPLSGKKRLHCHFLTWMYCFYQDRHFNGKRLWNNDDETIILNQNITRAAQVCSTI